MPLLIQMSKNAIYERRYQRLFFVPVWRIDNIWIKLVTSDSYNLINIDLVNDPCETAKISSSPTSFLTGNFE